MNEAITIHVFGQIGEDNIKRLQTLAIDPGIQVEVEVASTLADTGGSIIVEVGDSSDDTKRQLVDTITDLIDVLVSVHLIEGPLLVE